MPESHLRYEASLIPDASDEEVIDWYLGRIAWLTALGRRASGEQDWRAAQVVFGTRLTVRRFRRLRGVLVPAE